MFFPYSRWLSTPLSVRVQIAHKFGIEKKGNIEVFNNEVIKDGYLIKDIEDAITLSALQKFLGTVETDPHVLWGYLVEKINNPEINKISAVVSPEEVTRMNKEYEERTGKIAPVEEKMSEVTAPLDIDQFTKVVNENNTGTTLGEVVKKKGGRPKGKKDNK